MYEGNKYIRFDWAVKHMLRDKANFGVLEGLITVLIGEPVKIIEILEREGNQENAVDKFNRVDIKVRNDKQEIIIVEVQLTRQYYYLQRILYGAAKTITEHIALGEKYDQISKVYSISILYCDLGSGKDYLYKGKTTFRGVFAGDELTVFTKDEKTGTVYKCLPEVIFPEYFLIRVNNYDKIPENAIDEWVDYLKTGRINKDTTAPGLQEVRNKLLYLNMSDSECLAYDRHLDSIMAQNDSLDTAKTEGYLEGHKKGIELGLVEGRAEGHAEGLAEGLVAGRAEGERIMAITMARRMLQSGMDLSEVKKIAGLSDDDLSLL